MDVFVARQPIFQNEVDVFAYELLFRNGKRNFCNEINGEQATLDVIINSFLGIGIDKIANNKKCFINFTEILLLKKIPMLFMPESIVVEILEDVEPTVEIISVCKELKKLGYTIALDDVTNIGKYEVIIDYIDIIKIDFSQTNQLQRKKLLKV